MGLLNHNCTTLSTIMKSLTEDNFILFASKMYDNPECESQEEFLNDLKRINYIKKLLNKYLIKGELKTRLILNHITVLHNVFGIKHTARMLLFKLDTELHPSIKTFLVYKYSMPEKLHDIDVNAIPLDIGIINTLREI